MALLEQKSANEVAYSRAIAHEITSFVHSIDALQASLPALSVISGALFIACEKSLRVFLEKNCEEILQESTANSKNFKILPEHFLEVDRLSARLSKAKAGMRLLPQNYLVALVSQYDAYLGGLLRCLYRAKPEVLKQSEKQLTYSQLSDFSDLEQAKESILEKEIESVLRMSHSEQFEFMEKRFTISLRKDLPSWPSFIELTERRNLFVHCNGKVSAQYLIVCDKWNVDFSKRPAIGETLEVTADYFKRAHACVFEIGTKLAHTLWRKILPGECERADGSLNMLVYDLLVVKHYDLAIVLADFALKIPKAYLTDSLRRMMVVNYSQAYKWKGNQAQAVKIIDSHDWSSCSDMFKLAVAVIKDDFKEAVALMRKMGSSGPDKHEYRCWPLFNDFRKTQDFLDAYQSIFGQALEPIETSIADTIFPFQHEELGANLALADLTENETAEQHSLTYEI